MIKVFVLDSQGFLLQGVEVVLYQTLFKSKQYGTTDKGVVFFNITEDDRYQAQTDSPPGASGWFQTQNLSAETAIRARIEAPEFRVPIAPPPAPEPSPEPLPPPSPLEQKKSGAGIYYLLPIPMFAKLRRLRERFLKRWHRRLHPLI